MKAVSYLRLLVPYHPSAEILIMLGDKHHDGTTYHMNLWQQVIGSGKKKSDLTSCKILKINLEKGQGVKILSDE